VELDESGKRIDVDSVDERDDGRVPRHAQKNQKVYPGIKQDGWSGILRDRDAAKCRGGECTSSGIHQVMVELQLSPPIGCHSKWDGEGDDVKERNKESQCGSVHFRSRCSRLYTARNS
jgi:hypothetical protein